MYIKVSGLKMLINLNLRELRINIMNKYIKILAVLITLGLLLVSGCTGPSEEAEPVEELKEIRFGYQPSTHQITYMVADAKGWWLEDLEPYGITSIKDYEFPTGAPEMQAMLGNEIDVAYVGAAPVLSAIDQGLKAKIIAGSNIQGSDLVLANDLPYESPEDLKGLKIVTYPTGTMQPTVLRKWLIDNGIDPDNDLEIIQNPGGSPAAIAALASGEVDAVFLPHPSPSIIESEGIGRVVVKSGEMWPGHACCVVLVSEKLIRENPDIVEQIVRTHINATKYSIEHTEEAARIFSDKTKNPYNIANNSIQEWDGEWVADPNKGMDSILKFAKEQYDLGYTDRLLTEDDLFDTSFYNKIMAGE
jgi:NitT/TauT family transport system substrate-binding protein